MKFIITLSIVITSAFLGGCAAPMQGGGAGAGKSIIGGMGGQNMGELVSTGLEIFSALGGDKQFNTSRLSSSMRRMTSQSGNGYNSYNGNNYNNQRGQKIVYIDRSSGEIVDVEIDQYGSSQSRPRVVYVNQNNNRYSNNQNNNRYSNNRYAEDSSYNNGNQASTLSEILNVLN